MLVSLLPLEMRNVFNISLLSFFEGLGNIGISGALDEIKRNSFLEATIAFVSYGIIAYCLNWDAEQSSE